MEPLLVFPDPAPAALSNALDMAGYPWKCAGDATAAQTLEPDDGWAGAVILADEHPEAAFGLCRELRKRDLPLAPVGPRELDARLKHLFWRTGGGTRPELVEYGSLVLNLETYQAAVAGRPLDLTYMEYELLKFLASHPGKVFTRETLLSRVWGYEYYGGARTVDVHIRRLRAKLGEEHANLIQTVRSVGYRFGQSRWGV